MIRRTILRILAAFYESLILENWNVLYSEKTITRRAIRKLARKRKKLNAKLHAIEGKLHMLERKEDVA